MNLTRREFVIMTAGALAGCKTISDDAHTPRTVDAGPASNYASDGVYDRFRDQGFFLIRKGSSLTAISAICTHKKCKLVAEQDHSFSCPCHGSTFDGAGHVTQGPAKHDLPVFTTFTDGTGELFVRATGL